jgi:hypothetical protein
MRAGGGQCSTSYWVLITLPSVASGSREVQRRGGGGSVMNKLQDGRFTEGSPRINCLHYLLRDPNEVKVKVEM